MKRLKINLSIFAIVLATGAAFATKVHSAPAATLYGFKQSSGLWEIPQSGAHCTSNPSQNCEAQFNGDPNNGGTMVPGTLVKGNFVQ